MMMTGSQIFQRERSLLIAKQARSELLDQVANFCELKRGDPEDHRKVMGINRPAYHDPARILINLTLPWQSVTTEIVDLNFDIVTGKVNKCMKSCNPARPWGPKDSFRVKVITPITWRATSLNLSLW